MTKYFLYRITDKIVDVSSIPVPFLAGEGVLAQDGDMFVLYTSGNLNVLGTYVLAEGVFKFQKKSSGTIQERYDKLSFISQITAQTSRMFKKKCREISAEDFAVLS